MTYATGTVPHHHHGNANVDSDACSMPGAGQINRKGREIIDCDCEPVPPESNPACGNKWNGLDSDERKTNASERRDKLLRKLKSLLDKSVQHAQSATQAKYEWSMAVLLLYRLFNELKNSNLNRYHESLDRSMDLLDTMMTQMDAQIGDQKNAANAQNITDLVFSCVQIASQLYTLGKTAGLANDRKTAIDLPKNADQLDKAAKELEGNTGKVGALIDRMKDSTTAADPSTQRALKSINTKFEQTKGDVGNAANNSSAIKRHLESADTQEYLFQNDESMKRYHQIHQMAGTISGIGHAIGGLAAAPITAKSQEAGKEKEATDTRSQIEQQTRGLVNGYMDAFNQSMNSAINSFQQGTSVDAEAKKASARAA